jgi:hypothetical protein
MTPMWKKLNLKDQSALVVLNAPETFESEIAALEGTDVRRDLKKPTSFLLAFVVKQADLDRIAKQAAAKTEGDAIVWLAYPKKSSKRYRCEFNRDSGWEMLGALGFEGVRMVAIDEDWSALRFRRVEFVKTMTRDPKRAQTAEGKKRTKNVSESQRSNESSPRK